MSEFAASNGAVIGRNREQLEVTGDTYYEWLDLEAEKALREYFQHERDEELGRWRWPENPDYVVYPAENDAESITVLRESVSRIRKMRAQDIGIHDDFAEQFNACAEFYFEAHPERRPWSDAQIIMWRDGAYLPQIAQYDSRLGWRYSDETESRWYTEPELAKVIGDATVTILIEKDAS